MGDIVNFQSDTNKISLDERKKLIDSLLDIRLSLSIKKITKPTISKTELKEIIDDAKQKTEVLNVRQAIDDLFDEYFTSKKENIVSSERSLSVEEMEKMIENKINFNDEGNQKGTSIVKRDKNHFNSSNTDNKAA